MRRARGAAAVAVALVMALLVGGACSDGRDSQPGATVPPGGEGSSTSAPATTLGAEAYAVPEVIDQAYVQRVVSAYDKVLGDAIRILVRDQGVSEDFLEHLVGLYTQPQYEFQQRLWLEAVEQGDLEKRPETPGDPKTTVVRLVTAEPSCVVAQMTRDFRPTLREGVPQDESPEDDYVVLVRKPSRRDPLGVNPTPWAMAFDGFKLDNSPPMNSCED